MGDPKQPERWSKWYNCKEIKSFRMLGKSANTKFEGFKEWVEKMSAAPNSVKCFRGYMYSHSNYYEDFVKDRTTPIMQCISVGNGVKCFSLHDCGCSTAASSKNICNRAKQIKAYLAEKGSNMLVHFDAANEDQALPGGLHRLDKSEICAANPDGFVKDEFYWRRIAITRNNIWVFRHKRSAPGKWEWVMLSPEEFDKYCAGRLK
jgi:hypothetical protein